LDFDAVGFAVFERLCDLFYAAHAGIPRFVFGQRGRGDFFGRSQFGQFYENMVIDETLLIAFGLLLGLAGAAQFFPDFHRIAAHLGRWQLLSWQFSLQPLYLLGVFLVTLLLSRAFYEFVPQPNKTKWVAALALGLFSAEIFWAESFLPLHYSAQGLILLCLFYFCLILNYYHLFQTLTVKKNPVSFDFSRAGDCRCGLGHPWKILA